MYTKGGHTVVNVTLCSFFGLYPFPPISLGFVFSLDSLLWVPTTDRVAFAHTQEHEGHKLL